MLSGLATRARPWNLGLHLLSSLTLQSSASFGLRSMMYGSTQQSALLGQSPTSRLCPKAMAVSHAAPPRCSILPLGASSKHSPQHVTPDGERLISNSGSKAEERLRNTRAALADGTLGFGFSAGGFLYPYHLGVLWELHNLRILKDYKVRMSGASAGSLAIATYNCGLDVDKATEAMLSLAADCRAKGTRYRLGSVVREFLHAYLPDDAHERCRGVTHIHITRVFPGFGPEVISEFRSRDDFIDALLTSCHIPLYLNGKWATRFREGYYMDGGVAAFIPRPPTPCAVKVSCFPVNELLSRVQGQVEKYERVASLLDVAISPDAFEPWPYDYATMATWALVPAEDALLKYFIAKGRRDAHEWSVRMQLVPGEEVTSTSSSGSSVDMPAYSRGGGVLLSTTPSALSGSSSTGLQEQPGKVLVANSPGGVGLAGSVVSGSGWAEDAPEASGNKLHGQQVVSESADAAQAALSQANKA